MCPHLHLHHCSPIQTHTSQTDAAWVLVGARAWWGFPLSLHSEARLPALGGVLDPSFPARALKSGSPYLVVCPYWGTTRPSSSSTSHLAVLSHGIHLSPALPRKLPPLCQGPKLQFPCSELKRSLQLPFSPDWRAPPLLVSSNSPDKRTYSAWSCAQ